MGINFKQRFLNETSEGITFSFSFSEDNEIIMSQYDKNGYFVESSVLIDEKVLDFSVDMDNRDRIHLICITEKGHLKYLLGTNGNWSQNTLTKLELKSTNYKYLTMKIVNDNVNIFYCYSNIINSSIWKIYHYRHSTLGWQRKIVASITAGKLLSPFYVDYDKFGTLHMVFKNTIKGTQHIYYTVFSSFVNEWSRTLQKISDTETDHFHPYLFIDRHDHVHVVYSVLENSHIKLAAKTLTMIKSYNNKWQVARIPNIYGNCTHPILFEENNRLKILFKQNDLLKILYSNNNGRTWVLDDSLPEINSEDAHFIRYVTYSKANTKINHIYGQIQDKIHLFAIDSETNKEIEPQNKTILKKKTDTKVEMGTKLTSKIPSNHQPIPNETEKIKNEKLKMFLSDTQIDIESILSKTNKIHTIKNEIQKILYDHTVDLDHSLKNQTEMVNEINTKIQTLQGYIQNYKTENDAFVQLLSSIKEKYQTNLSELDKIETQIDLLRKTIESSTKSTIFSRLLNIFKS